ncbi:hypothetical protein [Tropicibacter naphthalenivorans]|uniref:Uncharacterized protein n=1 Tax=Tropicibacter naphthalenivorans TaxID=441103 RepID=A0A0P1GEI7_9RHOB|nr:hypothetical protein [Tropicibacter naphthalenivorans]CUH79864.1 hypothetical protein TRN7648_02685 [Tropicibacter naphthalenivorans]SMC75774.1 hypothetical protein SAMN04488093_103316 [Tropicibacter naphthalenivorans]
MRHIMIALALIFSATLAQADITWKVDRLGAGSVMVMKDRVAAMSHVKRGSRNGLHMFDVFEGQGQNAIFLGSYKVTAQGNVVEKITADGAVTRFAPHNCARVLGKCTFTVTHADGFREQKTRITEATRTGLRYAEYGVNGLETEGALGLDTFGAAKAGWVQTAGKKKRKSKRVMIALK